MWIKSRPAIRVYCPPEVKPGSEMVATIELDAKKPVPVEWVDARLEGNESVTIGSGNSATTRRHRHAALVGRISKARQLPAGVSQFRIRFAIPESAPPSYAGYRARSEWTISVRASIPWWPDARASFVVNVVVLPPARVEPRSYLFSSDPSGPKGSKPHMEASVADVHLTPGGVLAGALAVRNVSSNRYTGASVALVGIETRHIGRRVATAEAKRYSIRVPLEPPREGERVPFRMRIPERVDPTCRGRHFNLSWQLELRAHVRFGRDLKLHVPCVVLPPDAHSGTNTEAPPAIGNDRVRAVWRAAAESTSVELDGGALRGRHAGSALEIEREHRGRDGIFLVATLRYADLGLHFDGGPATGFRRFLGSGVRLGHAGWDGAYYLSGRDETQVAAFGNVLVPALRELRVADVDDTHLVVELADAGDTLDTLVAFIADVQRVADAVAAGRKAIPAPRAMRRAEPAWRQVAESLSGELELARMQVRARVSGHAVRMATQWDPEGHAISTDLWVRPHSPVDEMFHLTRTEAEGWKEGDPARAGNSARHAFEQIASGARSLTLDERGLRVQLDAPLLDPRGEIARVRAMTELMDELRTTGAGFRG